ncbi:unnamed protein product [Moneuplotes crassus]|uniref:non-specific serine/threonine protein kinase n=1 Tax=Euplotes crassus TaxID=5936 RepID=A0AAD1UCT2_EUPCR|nr:unnamed protein product [Moneuplotes crassus]
MTTIGNYKLIKKIGTGGFSKVMLAEEVSTGQKVALKLMKNSDTRQGIHRKNLFESEVAVLKELDSENILKLKDSDVSAPVTNTLGKVVDLSYIALEYAQNGELFDYVANGEKFSERTTRFFFHQIVDTLKYMHSKGYSHRDIKPENILFGSDFTLKFADFGFSTKKDICSQRRGTFGYMAPEVLANEAHDPKKADIFSAAVILFIMTTKHCPFIKADPNDKYYKLLIKGDIEQFWTLHENSNGESKQFSEDFKDLMTGMLSFDPSERFSLEDIQNHSWYNGPVAKKEDIEFEFRLRKKALAGSDETSGQKEENKDCVTANKNSDISDESEESTKSRDVEMTSSESEDLVTNYITVPDGDILVDVVVWYCTSKNYSYVKSPNFYRVNIEVGEHHNKAEIQVNILKKKKDGKRAVEFKTLSGSKCLTSAVFTDFQKFTKTHGTEFSN